MFTSEKVCSKTILKHKADFEDVQERRSCSSLKASVEIGIQSVPTGRPRLTKAKSFVQKKPTETERSGKLFKRADTIQCLDDIRRPDRGCPESNSNPSAPDPILPSNLGVRAWIQNWTFFLSVPRLMMLSHLKSFIGGTRAPSILPNDYMDNMLANVKMTMTERGLSQINLPDQEAGVLFYNGQLSGLTNLQRKGDAKLIAEPDHFIFSFAIEAQNIEASYKWKKRRLRGKISSTVARVTLKLKIKQLIQNNNPPELIDFEISEIDPISVNMKGLGPLNWMIRRMLESYLRRHLVGYLEQEGRVVLERELKALTLNDLIDASFLVFPVL